MTGIYLLFLALLWLIAVFFIAKLCTHLLPKSRWRVPIGVLLFLVLVPLPLIDEIVGKGQFEQLCRGKAEIVVDAQTTRGRTVWFGGSQQTHVRLGMLQVTQARRTYIDVKTQEPVYHYYRLEARGGLLTRSLGIAEGGTPMLFSGLCQPANLDTIDVQLGVTRINRPTSD